MTKFAREAAAFIQQKIPHFKPKIAIVLGSGLGSFANEIQDATIISYEDLPGFHKPDVAGHAGKLYLGKVKGVPVVCMQGRAHYYEGINNTIIQTMFRTLKLIGCEIFFATNASGSMMEKAQAGDLVVVSDHINFQCNNPLVGANDEAFGERFLPMENAYDPLLRQQLFNVAKQLDIKLVEGIYIGVLGPSFETPAEIRAFRKWGADIVGMSTIPEVIIARHCGMKVVVVSVVTNMAVGMSNQSVNHTETILGAEKALKKMTKLLLGFIENQLSS